MLHMFHVKSYLSPHDNSLFTCVLLTRSPALASYLAIYSKVGEARVHTAASSRASAQSGE